MPSVPADPEEGLAGQAEDTTEAARLAQDFVRHVEGAVSELRSAFGGAAERRRSIQGFLLTLLHAPRVRVTMMQAPPHCEEDVSPTEDMETGSCTAGLVQQHLSRLSGGDSPWAARSVVVAAAHRSATWEDVEEMCSNALHPPPVEPHDEGAGRETSAADIVEVAVIVIRKERWPERLLKPMLESILRKQHEHLFEAENRCTAPPEVMAVLCDSGSSERLLMEYKLLDLQCSHICGAAKNLTACSEKDRSDLRAVVACRGTLHMALNRVTSSSMVLLPRRFSERLLVLAALIRVRCDATLLTATPGPWVHSLMQIWLHTMFVLCEIHDEHTLEWRDAASFQEFGFDAATFSGGAFDARGFDALSGHGPGAAERLVGSMARIGLISMQHLPASLSLAEIAPFRSSSHGLRIIGWCSHNSSGEAERAVPGFIPELLDLVGERLLKTYLMTSEHRLVGSASSTHPIVLKWHQIWAVLRQTAVTLFARGGGQREFAVFWYGVWMGVSDLLRNETSSDNRDSSTSTTFSANSVPVLEMANANVVRISHTQEQGASSSVSERGWIAANDEEDQSSGRVNRSDATFDWDTPNFMVPGRRTLKKATGRVASQSEGDDDQSRQDRPPPGQN